VKRDLKGLRTLITGASSGIGRCLAEEAAREGMRLALTARSADSLQELAQSLTSRGADAIAVPADITSGEERARLLEAVTERFGGLDVLVNNAGVGSQGFFTDSTPEIARQVMEVNFFAPAELIRAAVPVLTNGRQPAIVNVSSMCGRRAMAMWSEYSASKYALCGLSEALRGEMVRFGIDVLTILPGLTKTGLQPNLLSQRPDMVINFKKGMEPEWVARAILTALRRNRTETVVGFEARWILRVNRFLPRLVDRLIGRFVRRNYTMQHRPQSAQGTSSM
jgi:short-subunit dehydrogenase